jgi:ABC-type transport system involved in Fe-S cluster assembly fused permease/ATPase subunit
MSTATPPTAAPEPVPAPVVVTAERQSIPQIVSQALADVSALVRLEIELARTELSEQAKQGAAGFALVIVAAFLAFLASILLSFAAVYGLAEVMPVWAAFLVVAGVYLVVGVVLVLVGRSRVQRLRGPEKAKTQLELTKQALRPSP